MKHSKVYSILIGIYGWSSIVFIPYLYLYYDLYKMRTGWESIAIMGLIFWGLTALVCAGAIAPTLWTFNPPITGGYQVTKHSVVQSKDEEDEEDDTYNNTEPDTPIKRILKEMGYRI